MSQKNYEKKSQNKIKNTCALLSSEKVFPGSLSLPSLEWVPDLANTKSKAFQTESEKIVTEVGYHLDTDVLKPTEINFNSVIFNII